MSGNLGWLYGVASICLVFLLVFWWTNTIEQWVFVFGFCLFIAWISGFLFCLGATIEQKGAKSE